MLRQKLIHSATLFGSEMPCFAASTYELESHLSLVPADMLPERRALAPFPKPEQRCHETLVTRSLQPSGESQKTDQREILCATADCIARVVDCDTRRAKLPTGGLCDY